MPSRAPVLFEFAPERYADNLGPVLEIVAEKDGPHAREGGSGRTRVPDLVKRDPKVFQKNDARRHGDPFPRDTGGTTRTTWSCAPEFNMPRPLAAASLHAQGSMDCIYLAAYSSPPVC